VTAIVVNVFSKVDNYIYNYIKTFYCGILGCTTMQVGRRELLSFPRLKGKVTVILASAHSDRMNTIVFGHPALQPYVQTQPFPLSYIPGLKPLLFLGADHHSVLVYGELLYLRGQWQSYPQLMHSYLLSPLHAAAAASWQHTAVPNEMPVAQKVRQAINNKYI
jgi:hypothetical protein